MKRIVISVFVVGLIMGNATVFAGILPGGISSTLELAYEDDRLDNDQSLAKAKLTLKRSYTIAGHKLTPFVYFENESNESFLSASNWKETESAIGVAYKAYTSDMLKLTMSTIYEYEDNATGDDDGLFIIKMKAIF